MAKQRTSNSTYMVAVYEDPAVSGGLRFTFVPKGTVGASVPKGTVRASVPKGTVRASSVGEPRPQYIVSVRGTGEPTEFNWIRPPADEETQRALEEIALARSTARKEWLEKLKKLVATVKKWADELDWATKAVEKKMEDAEIGNYKAPGLLLQQEAVRLFLEPVARNVPGAQGVVDLYLMPSYDDIASLYYYNDAWNVHYMFEGTPTVGNIREAPAKPLTKAILRKLFDEMKSHAG